MSVLARLKTGDRDGRRRSDGSCSSPVIAEELASYIATGREDEDGWRRYPGESIAEKVTAHQSALRHGLLERVRELEAGCSPPSMSEGRTTSAFVRDRLRPMIHGLFPVDERDHMLDVVTRSIVFLTQDVVHELIASTSWPDTALNVARIWLDSIGAPPLSEDAVGLLGLSEGTQCLVSLSYFRDIDADPFADYVVHEVAHLFHNNKRCYVGLPAKGRREWLLDIEFRKRELFAHACEFYSRIATAGRDQRAREALVEDLAPRAHGFSDQFDPDELIDVLREAASARNGWRKILCRCAPPTQRARATAEGASIRADADG